MVAQQEQENGHLVIIVLQKTLSSARDYAQNVMTIYDTRGLLDRYSKDIQTEYQSIGFFVKMGTKWMAIISLFTRDGSLAGHAKTTLGDPGMRGEKRAPINEPHCL